MSYVRRHTDVVHISNRERAHNIPSVWLQVLTDAPNIAEATRRLYMVFDNKLVGVACYTGSEEQVMSRPKYSEPPVRSVTRSIVLKS